MADFKPDVGGNTIAIPNIFCHTCLSTNRQLWPTAEYKDLCEKLFIKIKMIQKLDDMMVCWECVAYLRNVTRFLRRTEKAQVILYNTFVKHKNYELKSQSNLSKSKITHTEDIIHEGPVEVEASFDTFDDIIKEETEVATDFNLELGDLDYGSAPDSPQNVEYVPDLDEQDLNSRESTPVKEEQYEVRKEKGKKRSMKMEEGICNVTGVDFSYDNYKAVPVERSDFIDFLAKQRTRKEFLNAKFRCESCVLTFYNGTKMKKHMKCHDEAAGSYVCDICKRYYKIETLLINHLKEHNSVYECQLCSLRIKKENRIKHFKQNHKQKVECLKCRSWFCSISSFNRHYNSSHLAVFICDHCGVSFHKKGILRKHIQSEHIIYKCDACDVVFKQKYLLNQHNAFKHKKASNVEEAYCVECNLQFDTVHQYKRHYQTSVKHTKTSRYNPTKCPNCDKMYSRKTFMMNHYRLVHLKKTKYYCSPCDRYFLNRTRLRDHEMYNHEGKQRKMDKKCYICGRCFYDNTILAKHILTHTGERPHSCPHCPARFIQKYAMNMHVKTIHLKMKRNKDVPTPEEDSKNKL